jgi:hypothetical protein
MRLLYGIVAVVLALSLTILDADLMQERMRPGGRRVGWHFLPLIVLIFVVVDRTGLARARRERYCCGDWQSTAVRST